jgi:hypothetical protein
MDSSEIERELEELESRIERLRALYEQYFMGLEKLEPQIPRKDVERRIWILRREQIRNTGLRFKFQMLIQRFNTFQQYWSRVAREIENGTYRRDVMRVARRFGAKDALTIVGRRRAEQYASLASAQEARRRSGDDAKDEEILEADDLLEDEDEEVALGDEHLEEDVSDDDAGIEDETPTPVTLQFRRSSAMLPPPRPPSPPRETGKPPPPRETGKPPPPRDAGKRRVAELAAQVRAPRRKDEVQGAGPLELDLDLDGPRAASSRKTTRPPPRRAPSAKVGTIRPPATVAPPSKAASSAASRRATSKSMRAVRSQPLTTVSRVPPPEPPEPPPVAATQNTAASSSPQTPARAATSSTASRHERSAGPNAARKPDPEALEDKRLRQIYATYIETKRTVNEPTAGITFEKLAESLRAQAAKLRASHPAKTVDYEVVVKNGKTLLKPILR